MVVGGGARSRLWFTTVRCGEGSGDMNESESADAKAQDVDSRCAELRLRTCGASLGERRHNLDIWLESLVVEGCWIPTL